ncbi:hypothetical protein [Rickettsia tamurae]|nr:hypothetical protein [Rickettsia tamurae]
MKELIEFLEKRGGRQADSLRKGDTTLYLGSNQIGDSEERD